MDKRSGFVTRRGTKIKSSLCEVELEFRKANLGYQMAHPESCSGEAET